MKKTKLIGISILSIFILCSLSYQPIIADKQIESKPIIVDDTKTTDEDIDELKELYYTIKSRIPSDEDCDCSSNTAWGFPIICSLIILFLFIFILINFICYEYKLLLLGIISYVSTAVIFTLYDFFNCSSPFPDWFDEP